MGIPWIKNGKIDKTALNNIKWRNASDSITFIEACQIIADRINEAEEDREAALAKVKEYEENINADTRVKKLNEKLAEIQEEVRRGFTMTKSETSAVSRWKNNHDLDRHNLDTLDKKLRAGGAIGGRYHYEFHPTSIGTSGYCICGYCQRKAIRECEGNIDKYNELLDKYDARFEFAELG